MKLGSPEIHFPEPPNNIPCQSMMHKYLRWAAVAFLYEFLFQRVIDFQRGIGLKIWDFMEARVVTKMIPFMNWAVIFKLPLDPKPL